MEFHLQGQWKVSDIKDHKVSSKESKLISTNAMVVYHLLTSQLHRKLICLVPVQSLQVLVKTSASLTVAEMQELNKCHLLYSMVNLEDFIKTSKFLGKVTRTTLGPILLIQAKRCLVISQFATLSITSWKFLPSAFMAIIQKLQWETSYLLKHIDSRRERGVCSLRKPKFKRISCQDHRSTRLRLVGPRIQSVKLQSSSQRRMDSIASPSVVTASGISKKSTGNILPRYVKFVGFFCQMYIVKWGKNGTLKVVA